MKKIYLLSLIAICAMTSSCNKPVAQKNDSGKDSIQASTSPSIEAIRTANNLAKYGYEIESALALTEAADILISIPTGELKTESKKENVQNDDNKEKATFSAEQLLSDAKQFAEDDSALLEIISRTEQKLEAQAQVSRGAINGPNEHNDRVLPESTDVYRITFKANELAEILVMGDGDTDLDLYIYDENGNLIKSDTDYSDICYASFWPKWTGAFIIKIANRGNVSNYYQMLTN